MYRALFTAASGMKAQQAYIDTIANNLANVNTNGFKGSTLSFQDLLYENLEKPGTEAAEGYQMPTGLEIGSGVRVVSSVKSFTQGDLEQTGGSLDLAVQGKGFFKIQMADGTYAYSRDGQFGLDGTGRIVRSDGMPLADNIIIPADAQSINIGQDGKVSVTTGNDTSEKTVGTITLTIFANPAGLQSIGDNLYRETVASGAPTAITPGNDGNGVLRQGFLERSNVETVAELVHLITAQRAYEINTKAISISDKMFQLSNNLIR